MTRRAPEARPALSAFEGRSSAIARVRDQVSHLAPTRATVLIEGEPGSGKRRAAAAIHDASPRRGERFVALRLGDFPQETLEAELFGVEEGAGDARPGRVELASAGTLFVDQIERAPASLQIRLLRLIQDRTAERVGSRTPLKVDPRLVAATEADLSAETRAGRFRDDLYQRLGAVRIAMPALRTRREDIPFLVEIFVAELNREHGRKVTGITRGALERLTEHPWPGNVGELRRTVESMVMFAERRRPLDMADLPQALRRGRGPATSAGLAVGMTVAEAERQLIEATLRHTAGDKPRAAAMLGIGLRTLYRKIERYRLG